MKTSLFLSAICLLLATTTFSQDDPFDHVPVCHTILSPNPVTSHAFAIQHDSASCDHFERLVIYNSNGVVMQSKELEFYKGSSRQRVDISSFPSGNYFVRLIDLKDPSFSFSTQLLVD